MSQINQLNLNIMYKTISETSSKLCHKTTDIQHAWLARWHFGVFWSYLLFFLITPYTWCVIWNMCRRLSATNVKWIRNKMTYFDPNCLSQHRPPRHHGFIKKLRVWLHTFCASMNAFSSFQIEDNALNLCHGKNPLVYTSVWCEKNDTQSTLFDFTVQTTCVILYT